MPSGHKNGKPAGFAAFQHNMVQGDLFVFEIDIWVKSR